MPSVAVAAVRTMRPRQWVKNLFVAAPLVFAKHLVDGGYLWRTGIAVAAFCALSGAVYAINDVLDAEADRAHRPSGTGPSRPASSANGRR